MEKPILATNIDGSLINHEAFFEPHRIWFDRAILLTKDESLNKWKGQKDYFIGVDKAMEKIIPNATKEERTTQARKWYQEDVIHYIKNHPELVNTKVKEIFLKLKSKYRLALVTSNTKEHINEILVAANLKKVFDIIFATDISEKPVKSVLFEKFTKQYGKSLVYIAAKNREAWEDCSRLSIITVYAGWDKPVPELEKKADIVLKDKNMLLKLKL